MKRFNCWIDVPHCPTVPHSFDTPLISKKDSIKSSRAYKKKAKKVGHVGHPQYLQWFAVGHIVGHLGGMWGSKEEI